MSDALTNKMATKQPYRHDIDGLRAIAVLAVVIGHSFDQILPGGYLGVDVFFVISGYVITMSLLARADQGFGRFASGFFLRRIKRLMPALIVCFTLTSLAILILDREPKTSLLTGAVSLVGFSNFSLYFQELDYFSASTKYNAFTHTWSLGVEEQFYLLFPFVFWLAFSPLRKRRARLLLGIILGVSLFSVVTFLALQNTAPTAAYYLMPFRFWELGCGVAAAILVHLRQFKSGQNAQQIETTLVVIALCVIFFVSGEGKGVVGHLAAVLLTAHLLISGAGASSHVWVLRNPVSTYIGKISYSLYLWHWPFLTFALLAPTSFISNPFLAIAAAFGAAALSYSFVEQPVRKLKTPVPAARHFGTALGAILGAIIVIASANEYRKSQISDVALNPFPPHFLPLPVSGLPYNPTCVVDQQERKLLPSTFENCTFRPTQSAQRPKLWVLGDSHAGHLQGGLVRLRDTHGYGFHLVSTPGAAFPVTQDHGFASRDLLMEKVRANWTPGDVVVLSRLFFQRAEKPQLSADVQEWLLLVDDFASELAASGVNLLLIGPAPMFQFEDIRACDPADRLGCGIERTTLTPSVGLVLNRLEEVAGKHTNVEVLDSFNMLCPPAVPICVPSEDGVFLFRDRDHLNVAGAQKLTDGLHREIRRFEQ